MLRFVLKLPTSRRNISSSAFANDRVDVVLLQNPLESNHGFIGWPLIGQPFNFIPPQQVHRTSEATNHVDQSVGMLGLVIDTSQQHVLQSDFSTGSIKPGRAGIEKSSMVLCAAGMSSRRKSSVGGGKLRASLTGISKFKSFRIAGGSPTVEMVIRRTKRGIRFMQKEIARSRLDNWPEVPIP